MTIKQIFDEISSTSSTTTKMDILRKYIDNALLKDVLYTANSKRVKFYIKQLPVYMPNENASLTLEEALEGLKVISNRVLTGNDAINYLAEILSSCTTDDAYIIQRIIEKDCKIGMGTSNMNKVFTRLIEDTPYMGAKSYDPKLIKKLFEKGGKAYSQVKMDGRYCNAIIRGGEVEMESRQGEPTILIPQPKFVGELSKLTDCVLNGELTMMPVERKLKFNKDELIEIDGVKYTVEEIKNKFSPLVE